MKKVYEIMKDNWKREQTIKNDRFLSKALIEGAEFFEIEVCHQTGVTELIDRE